jgi:hypothetical protein
LLEPLPKSNRRFRKWHSPVGLDCSFRNSLGSGTHLVILLNFDGSRYSVGDFRNFRWSPGSLLRRLVVKFVPVLSFSVPLHQTCARAQIILKATAVYRIEPQRAAQGGSRRSDRPQMTVPVGPNSHLRFSTFRPCSYLSVRARLSKDRKFLTIEFGGKY